MWVFTYKFDEDGYLLKYKARLVVRGDLQAAKDQDTYATTLATRVFRALMAIAAYFDLEIYQYDAVNAFINALVDNETFICYPDGFYEPGHCLQLLRALYGLPRSPLLWFNNLSAKLKEFGLEPVPECSCLFTNNKIVVFFYVDDIIVLFHKSSQSSYNLFHINILQSYNLREMGEPKWFLGIRIIQDRHRRKI